MPLGGHVGELINGVIQISLLLFMIVVIVMARLLSLAVSDGAMRTVWPLLVKLIAWVREGKVKISEVMWSKDTQVYCYIYILFLIGTTTAKWIDLPAGLELSWERAYVS